MIFSPAWKSLDSLKMLTSFNRVLPDIFRILILVVCFHRYYINWNKFSISKKSPWSDFILSFFGRFRMKSQPLEMVTGYIMATYHLSLTMEPAFGWVHMYVICCRVLNMFIIIAVGVYIYVLCIQFFYLCLSRYSRWRSILQAIVVELHAPHGLLNSQLFKSLGYLHNITTA